MTFAKLENGILKRCPKAGMSGKSYKTNLPLYYSDNPSVALKDGWKELVETERPDGNCVPEYTQTDTRIVRNWIRLPEIEPEPTLEDKIAEMAETLSDLTDAILEMSEQVYA